jgi:signal transduction histidine kinase
MDELDDDVSAVARIDAVPTILEVVCRVTGMGFAAVARVTEERWIACAVRDEIQFGLEPGGELKVETTICNEIRASGDRVVIDDVRQDEAFCRHPTPAMYGFQSYISVPIRRNGAFFGTLCAIDPRPARLDTPETVGMFTLFADLIGFHLDAQERLASSEAALLDEQQAAVLREQFVAVLAHDLRNPLASIEAGLRLLGQAPLDEREAAILALVTGSTRRMAGLIDDVLDFTRARLGGDLISKRDDGEPLGPLLEQVVGELRAARSDRVIKAEIAVSEPVACDPPRIARLLSNLLANALDHGAPDKAVSVRATTQADMLTISVSNHGDPIPPEAAARLFQPFFRASARSGQHGLGLGLYIASEIARGHGGTLKVSSTRQETCFTFQMPARSLPHYPDRSRHSPV